MVVGKNKRGEGPERGDNEKGIITKNLIINFK